MSRLVNAGLALLGAALFNSTRQQPDMIPGCPLPPRAGWSRAKVLSLSHLVQPDDEPRADGTQKTPGGYCYVDGSDEYPGRHGNLVHHSLTGGRWYKSRFDILEEPYPHSPEEE